MVGWTTHHYHWCCLKCCQLRVHQDESLVLFIVFREKTSPWPPGLLLLLQLIFHSSFLRLWRMFVQGWIMLKAFYGWCWTQKGLSYRTHAIVDVCFMLIIEVFGCFEYGFPWRRGNEHSEWQSYDVPCCFSLSVRWKTNPLSDSETLLRLQSPIMYRLQSI